MFPGTIVIAVARQQPGPRFITRETGAPGCSVGVRPDKGGTAGMGPAHGIPAPSLGCSRAPLRGQSARHQAGGGEV